MPKRKAPKDKTGVKEEGLPEAPAAKKASTGGSQKSTRGLPPLPASPRPTRQGSPRLLPDPREVATRHPAQFPMTPRLLSMTTSWFIPPYMREYLTYHQSHILKSAQISGLTLDHLTIDDDGMIHVTGQEDHDELRIGSAVTPPQVLSGRTEQLMEDLIEEKGDSIWWKHTVLAAKGMLAEDIENFSDLEGALKTDLEAWGWSASIINMMGKVLQLPKEKENGVVKNHLVCPMNKQHPGITIADARKALGEAILEEVQVTGAKREKLEERLELFCLALEAGRWGLAANQFKSLRRNLLTATTLDLDEVWDLVDKEFMTEKANQMASTYGSWKGMDWIYGVGDYVE